LTGVDWPPKKFRSLLELLEIFAAALKFSKRPKWGKQKGPFSRISLWWRSFTMLHPEVGHFPYYGGGDKI
jgi:hypothetical protein